MDAISIAITIVTSVFGIGASVISYFARRDQEISDKRLTALEKDCRDLLLAKQTAEQQVKTVDRLEDNLRDLTEKVADAEKSIAAASRASATDDREHETRLRHELVGMISAVQNELRALREDCLRWQTAAAEKYLVKTDFVRDSSMLDTRVSGIFRTVKKVEEGLDAILRDYVGKKP